MLDASSAEMIRSTLIGSVRPELIANSHEGLPSFCFGCERKTLTILFADIRGFTAMADQLEPEVVGDLLNEHFTEMSKIVLSQNGMIDKYIGDGMMVLFGVPAADADDPRRAVWSAVKMQRKFLEIRNRWTKRIPETTAIDLGIGIHCGDVVFGNFGSRKKTSYTAIGDTVNIASRLEGIAKRHQVIISKSVASHLPDTFRLEELGPRQIRGKTSQLELYNVILE